MKEWKAFRRVMTVIAFIVISYATLLVYMFGLLKPEPPVGPKYVGLYQATGSVVDQIVKSHELQKK